MLYIQNERFLFFHSVTINMEDRDLRRDKLSWKKKGAVAKSPKNKLVIER